MVTIRLDVYGHMTSSNPVRLLRSLLMKFFLQVLSLVSWGAGNSPTPVVLDQHDLQHLQTHDQIST